MSAPPAIPSPCIGVCLLDSHRHCIGCLRTLDEIARWASMDARERDAVLRRIAKASA